MRPLDRIRVIWGLNNSIKVTRRMSCGLETFERMRRRCLLSLGCMRIVERGVKVNGVKLEDPRL
ncbi:hypothetical protein [Adlercreutzia sp. ZJ473]|uniref:hypothetical protein n=1 Tax=Adlercreutzia sp. ZJ473 TaxID=2722822 RepID=UPI0015582EFE|nr:hypothetical protein [Adlercreutzia sp. ZJ473]